MKTFSPNDGRAIGVLSRYALVLKMVRDGRGVSAVLSALGTPSASAPPNGESQESGGASGSGRHSLVPPVLFSDALREPEQSEYRDLMGRLDVDSRAGILKLDLRDLFKLAEAGLVEWSELESYRQFDGSAPDFDVYDFVSYLNDLAFLRYITETTANCYRRWVAAYLESINHPDSPMVRNWVVPYSKRFYVMVFGFLDYQSADGESGEGKEVEGDMQLGSFRLSELQQLDLFGVADLLPESRESSSGSGVEQATREAERLLEAHELDSHRKEVNRKVGEYAYISGTVWDVLGAELSAMRTDGQPRYKYGQLSAVLFLSSLMTGLRHVEWFDAILHEDGYTDTRGTGMTLGCPVLQVFTVKQNGRREDNPLRDFRLLVLDTFTADQLEVIRVALYLIGQQDSSKQAVMLAVRRQINRVWKKLVKQGRIEETQERDIGYRHNGVSMHTARKTFAEEVRRSMEYTRFELAAMLGHTTLMNLKYYSKVRKILPRTHAFALPRPWPGDAEEVQEWNESITNYLTGNDLARKMREVFEASSGGLSEAQDWDDTLRY